MNVYTATAPNGKVLTKKTKKQYSHAVMAIAYSGDWVIIHASSSKDGAEKIARTYDSVIHIAEFKVAA